MESNKILIEFTKSDCILMMQLLNRTVDRTPPGHSYRKLVPKIQKKFDDKLLDLMQKEEN